MRAIGQSQIALSIDLASSQPRYSSNGALAAFSGTVPRIRAHSSQDSTP
ncbi:hypothetical protein [Bradyrhizobium sp.]